MSSLESISPAQPLPASNTARRLLPGLILPLALGGLAIQVVHASWISAEKILAWFALANAALFAGLFWLNARRVSHHDAARRIAEAQAARGAEDQARLAAIVASSEDAIIGKTLEGIITSWNLGAQRIFGYTAAEAIGHPLLMLIPPERAEEERLLLGQIRAGRAVQHFETVRIRKDGAHLQISVTISPIRNAAGNIVGASKIARDISERRRSEELQRETDRRFRQMTETLPQLVWTCDPQGSCDYLSPQWAAYIGVVDTTADLGQGWLGRVHPEDMPLLRATWNDTVSRGAVFSLEFRIRRHDGAYRWFKISAVPLRDAQGGIVKWFGTNTDIHEERELHDSLREAQTRLQHTLEMGRIGTFSVDFETQRTVYDESLIKLYGRAWNETDGADPRPFLEHLPAEDRPGVMASLSEVMRTGEIGNAEFRYQRPDGTILWVASRIAAERDSQGRIRRLLGASVDVTQRIQSEEVKLHNVELASENRKVQEANRLKSEFLANMSHELRTPLNGIIGFTEFLIDGRPGPLNAKQLEYLADVYHSSQHLLQLINDVLDLSKIESGKMELVVSRFSLPQAIEQGCGILKGMADKQHVTIHHSVEAGLELVYLDSQKFKQILYNLLSNAVKFTDSGGRAEVRVHGLPGGHMRLEVSDTGIGIRAEDLPKLFQEFVQLDSGAARRFEGTGLGLALTRKLVELHQGDLSVRSVFGQGSTFTVTLPQDCRELEPRDTPSRPFMPAGAVH